MALEDFDFPNHSFKTENPESSFRVKLGGSYVFSTPPTDPDQRVFVLSFTGMRFFVDEDNVLDESINPQLNMFNLIKFYQRHKMYKSFRYEHPVHGTLEVKFNKPLTEEDVQPGGFGVVKDFSVELVEIP